MNLNVLLRAAAVAITSFSAWLPAAAQNAPSLSGATLTVAYQDPAFPALIEKSGVLDGSPYKVDWVLLTGPAANLSALYAGRVDLGHMGDTSLTIEQANARTEWTSDNIPLRIVAGWRNAYSKDFPPLITAVRSDTNITDPQQIKGHKVGYNYGGYNHAQYLATLVKAGLTEKDIEPIKFNDGATSAAAFNSGQVEVYAGGLAPVLSTIRSGAGRILLTDRDTTIPALGVWTATSSVLKDPAKVAALKDFFGRLSGYWPWHDAHRADVLAVLKDKLKISDDRAAFEYEIRSGSFIAFSPELIAQEQQIAEILFTGHAIRKQVNVAVEYDPSFNEAQKAIWPVPAKP